LKADQASSTAEAGLAVRALESLRPESSRLFQDVYAPKLLSKRNQRILKLCKFPLFRWGMEQLLDHLYPGVPSDFICRTRYIDDALSTALKMGAERVVVVGAGYDTRSFRIASERRVEVIEMDHPFTQKRKIESARRLLPSEVFVGIRFIPVDLAQKEWLGNALGESKKTVFILEGLTGYLPSDAVDALFRWMRDTSLPESRVIFTYVDQDFVKGKETGPGARRIASYLKNKSEPFIFGWKSQELAKYCEHQGFQLLETVSSAQCADRYLRPLGRRLNGADFFHLATAALAPDATVLPEAEKR
jgi:methyltransferase (TIGR00027 family)